MRASAFDSIIFDIDNVLIDTRRSYLDAIRWTVEIYLTTGNVPFFRRDKESNEPFLLSHKDVEEFKLLGGFNDDWDCCYGLLIYLLSLGIQGKKLSEFRRDLDLRAFSKRVKERPLRVSGIVKMLGANTSVKIERIGRIFQEVYLGKDLFTQIEKRSPIFWKKRGLINKEKLIFRKSFLEKIHARGVKFGVATGRPRFEATFALKRFGVLDLFSHMTTMDDVRHAEQANKQSLRKPHPFSLLETAKKIGGKSFLYVGDLPDDVMAAGAAKREIDVLSAAFVALSADRSNTLKEFQKAGADYVVKKPAELLDVIFPKVKRKNV